MGLFNHFIDRLTNNDQEQVIQQVSNERIVEHFDNYNHLMKLQDDRQLIEVCLPQHKNSFQSMIIGIDFIEGTFSLDGFSPRLQHPESLINQEVIIRHYKHWEKLEIKACITRWSTEEQCYYVSLPEFVDYQPRRNYPRLLLANSSTLKTHINPLYGAPWYAIVKDISQGGMRINISGDLRPHLHKDKVLPKCQIILDDNISIQSRGLVRAFSYVSKPYRHTDISIEFQNMSQTHQTDLKRFIEYIEIAA
jgi:c-di-GMP-binding flagellar brake protein YcgR